MDEHAFFLLDDLAENNRCCIHRQSDYGMVAAFFPDRESWSQRNTDEIIACVNALSELGAVRDRLTEALTAMAEEIARLIYEYTEYQETGVAWTALSQAERDHYLAIAERINALVKGSADGRRVAGVQPRSPLEASSSASTAETLPSSGSSSKSRFDRKAYQREYMKTYLPKWCCRARN